MANWNSWFILIYLELSWFILIYLDLSWFIMIYHDLSWFILIYPCDMVNFHSYVILSQPLPEGYRHFMRVVIGISWESSNFIMGASQRIFHKLARSDQPNCCDSAPQRIRAEADSRRHPGSWTTRPATSGFPSDHQWIIAGWFISGKFRKNGGELGLATV